MTIRGNRAYVVGHRDDEDGTYTTDIAIINLRDGEVLNGVQSFTEEGTPNSALLDIKTNGRAFLTIITYSGESPSGVHTTLYEFDTATGDLVAQSDPVDGEGKLIYDQDGTAQYLASTTSDGVTFTPLAGQPGGVNTFPPTDYVITADGNHAWVVFAAGPQTYVGLFDLENNQPPSGPPIAIDGQSEPGQAVLDDDGDLLVTTTLEDGSTRITRIPGDAPSGFRMMTLGAGPSAPANINVIYPEPEDSNPLVPEQFSSNSPGPSEFDIYSLLSV